MQPPCTPVKPSPGGNMALSPAAARWPNMKGVVGTTHAETNTRGGRCSPPGGRLRAGPFPGDMVSADAPQGLATAGCPQQGRGIDRGGQGARHCHCQHGPPPSPPGAEHADSEDPPHAGVISANHTHTAPGAIRSILRNNRWRLQRLQRGACNNIHRQRRHAPRAAVGGRTHTAGAPDSRGQQCCARANYPWA